MHPPDSVPLQGHPYAGQPTSMVQYTSVTVQRETLKDHVIWSLFNLVYCNPCCLGLLALIQSVQARDKKVAGDIEGARSHAETAQTLNIVVTMIFCLSVLICVIMFAVPTSNYSYYTNRHYY